MKGKMNKNKLTDNNARFLYFEGELVVGSLGNGDKLCEKIYKYIKKVLKKKGQVSVYRVIERF